MYRRDKTKLHLALAFMAWGIIVIAWELHKLGVF